MVVWPTVCKSTHLGGLGISDLKLQGFALQTEWLWLQKTDQERTWSELPIKTASCAMPVPSSPKPNTAAAIDQGGSDCWNISELSTSPISLGLVCLSYFSVMEQCFSLTTFQHKHQYKLNFSISEQIVKLLC